MAVIKITEEDNIILAFAYCVEIHAKEAEEISISLKKSINFCLFLGLAGHMSVRGDIINISPETKPRSPTTTNILI